MPLCMTPLFSRAPMIRWSLLNSSKAAFGVRTRRHAGYCREVGGSGGFGSSIRQTQNSILMVWASKVIPLTESANVSKTSALSTKRILGPDCFDMDFPFL
jgi:hypothetical protein